jgi:hypothetical protein
MHNLLGERHVYSVACTNDCVADCARAIVWLRVKLRHHHALHKVRAKRTLNGNYPQIFQQLACSWRSIREQNTHFSIRHPTVRTTEPPLGKIADFWSSLLLLYFKSLVLNKLLQYWIMSCHRNQQSSPPSLNWCTNSALTREWHPR